MNNKTHILIVNINNLKFTQDCVNDLLKQDRPFDLTLIDQNSNEHGTYEWYNYIQTNWNRIDCRFKIIKNKDNIDLNRVWNSFYETTKNEYLCFLNNDVRVTDNFVSDCEKIFNIEKNVGCVIHPTNHPNYIAKSQLKYKLINGGVMQGWDFTIRRTAYKIIPNELKIFCGDDYIFEHLYRGGFTLAYALSSPIIHYQGQSQKGPTILRSDINRYLSLGFEHKLRFSPEYSRIKPTFEKLL